MPETTRDAFGPGPHHPPGRAALACALTLAAACGGSGDGAVCAGDVTLTTREDALVARTCTAITGSLIISWSDVACLDLPALATVGGHVYVLDNAVLTSVSLPALTTVGGQVFVLDNAALTRLSLPALDTIGRNALPGSLQRLDSPPAATGR